MANSAADVIRIAAAEVGYSRWSDPEQGTKYGRWYAEKTGSGYYGTNGVPYCAMFVSWVMALLRVLIVMPLHQAQKSLTVRCGQPGSPLLICHNI